MSDFYVWASGSGTTGASWDTAFANVNAALAAATGTGPHRIYVDKGLTTTYAATAANYTPATASAKISIISVDRGGRLNGTGHSGWSAGASETTPDGFAFNIGTTRANAMYIFGMTLKTAANTSASNIFNIANTGTFQSVLTLDSCNLYSQGASSAATFEMGQTGGANATRAILRFINTNFFVRNSSTNPAFNLNLADGEFVDCTFGYSGASKPPNLFAQNSVCTIGGRWLIRDCDLSGFNTTSGSYFLLTNISHDIRVVNCKLSSVPSWVSGSWIANSPGQITSILNDSGDTHNRFRVDNPYGTLTEETTNVRNNGASFDGSPISWKVVTTASCSEYTPFVCPPINRWVRDLISQDIRIEILRGSATAWKNHEVWAQFATLQNASFPLGADDSTRDPSPTDTSGTSLPTSSETWAGGLSPASAVYCGVTKTIAEHSLVRGRVSIGSSLATLYICPAMSIGSQSKAAAVRWTLDGAMVVEPDTPTAISRKILTVDPVDLDEYLKEMT